MKRHFLTILISLFTGFQTWAHHFEVDGIYYNFYSSSDKTVSVTYRGSSYQEFDNEYKDVVVIPSTVKYQDETYKVIEIGRYAFKNCVDLKEITIPDGVKKLDSESFRDCISLSSINIPRDVEELGEYTFSGCIGLSKVIISAKHIMFVDETSFSGCSNVEEIIYAEGCIYAPRTYLYSARNISISNTVTELGLMMCTNFKNLEEISIPGNVTTIYDWAFDNCVNLRKVYFHEGLRRIGNQVFRRCSKLKNITIPSTVNYIATEAFSGVVKAFFKTYTKPSFGNNPFKSCQIYYTRNSVSYGIPGKHVEYPLIDSMFEVDDMVYIPTSEENKTCDFVDGLYSKSGCIPSKVTNNDCTYSVSKLGDYAFYGSNNLVKVIIPNSIATRGQYAFNECPKIDSVVVSCENFEDFSKYVSRSNIYDVFYAGILENKHHAITIGGSEVSSLIIPNTVNYINNYAFKGCSNIISADISEGVTNIGSNAFYGCDNMASVTIPSSVTSIGEKAFYNVIKTVFLTNSKPLIATDAFFSNQVYYTSNSDSYNIPGIQKVYPLLSSKFVVDGIKYIPTSMSDRTCDMYDIDYTADYISPIIGPNVKFTNSSGRQYDFKINNVNACAGYKSKEFSELLFNNEGTIDSNAFYGCKNIQEISFGENITTIGQSAFYGCTGISNLKIPATIKKIDEYAFEGCTSLDSLFFEDSNAPIRLNCRFQNGKKLYLGRDVVYSMESFSSPFSGNPRLENVKTNNNVTYIGKYEFYNCKNLKDVCLSDSIKTIGDYAFSGNSSLLTFEVGAGVCEIGSNAFSDCPHLLDFISYAIIPPHVAQGALDDINKMECTLHVPEGSKDAYKQADQWKEFWIEDDLKPTAIENIIFDSPLDDNKLFDILGRVIDGKSAKGFVISKGKKYLMR